MKNAILVLFLLHICVFGFSQQTGYGVLSYSQSIKKQKVESAKVISDINPRFKASWIKEYISVTLSVSCGSETLTAEGTGFTLNEEQQRILKIGDTGTDIVFAIKYYPNNNLPKAVKNMNFSFLIAPDIDAKFEGGETVMKKYLKENAIDRLSKISETEIHQIKISFNVAKDGRVTNVKVLQRSHSDKIDALLLATIRKMPKWIPAKNADGTVVSQTLEFVVSRDLCTYTGLFVD